MAKRIKLTTTQKKQLLRQYTEQLNSMTLLDNASKAFQENYTFKSKVKPVIKFTEKALLIIKELVQQCEKEIAWNGLVEHDATTNTFTVYDIVIFPQIVSGTSVDVDETKYAMWLASLTNEQLKAMRFHGHSHVNMGVRPSGVDTGYQKEMLDMQIQDYYIFMIFNKRGDMYACIYDVAKNAFYEDDDIIIEKDSQLNPYKTLVADWIEENVSLRTPAPAYPSSYSYGGRTVNITPSQPPTMGYWARQAVMDANKKTYADTLKEYTD